MYGHIMTKRHSKDPQLSKFREIDYMNSYELFSQRRGEGTRPPPPGKDLNGVTTRTKSVYAIKYNMNSVII